MTEYRQTEKLPGQPDECPRCHFFWDECGCGYMRNQLWSSFPELEFDDNGRPITEDDSIIDDE